MKSKSSKSIAKYVLIACVLITHSAISQVDLSDHTGIPDPALMFGYDPYTRPITPDPPGWECGEVPNYYYVDPSSPLATDTNNPFGYPQKPRQTMINFSVSPGGKIVLVGDGNEYSIGGPGRFEPSLRGDSSAPVLIEGRHTTAPPVLLNQLRLTGSKHVIIDGLKFTQSDQTISVKENSHYITIRNTLFYGPSENVGNRSVISASGASTLEKTSNIVIYNNVIKSWGENLITSPENDYHAVKTSRNVNNVWYTNNECTNLGGDCIQVGDASIPDTERPHHIYIAGNLMYNTLENCVDIKEADDVIISENTCHSFNRNLVDNESGNSDTAIIIHNNAKDIWVLNNTIHDVGTGVINTNGLNVNILGNAIYKVNPVGDYNPDSNYGNGQCIHVRGDSSGAIDFNTCSDYAKGVSFGSSALYQIYGNIFSERNREDGYEIMLLSSGDYSYLQSSDYNQYYNLGHQTTFKRGNYIEGLQSWRINTKLDSRAIEDNPAFDACSSIKFELTSESPAIDSAGPELRIYQEFEEAYGISIRKDIKGTSRPFNGVWDRGGMEYAN